MIYDMKHVISIRQKTLKKYESTIDWIEVPLRCTDILKLKP